MGALRAFFGAIVGYGLGPISDSESESAAAAGQSPPGPVDSAADSELDLTVTGETPGAHAEQDSGNYTGPPVAEHTEARQAEDAALEKAEEAAELEETVSPQTEAQKAKAERRAEAAKVREAALAEREQARAERAAAAEAEGK